MSHYSNRGLTADRLRCIRAAALSDARPSEGRPLRQAQRRLNEDEAKAMISRYQAGEGMSQLARQYRLTRQTVAAILKRSGVQLRQPGLETANVATVCHLSIDEGWSLARIAEKYGVSANTVRTVLLSQGLRTRRSFDHLLD